MSRINYLLPTWRDVLRGALISAAGDSCSVSREAQPGRTRLPLPEAVILKSQSVGFVFESKMRASEPWEKKNKNQNTLKRKSEKRGVSTCKVLFAGFALNIPFKLLLGFTLEFRNVGVKPGCIPLRCLQRSRV